jgi:hypothetical protein
LFTLASIGGLFTTVSGSLSVVVTWLTQSVVISNITQHLFIAKVYKNKKGLVLTESQAAFEKLKQNTRQ